MLKKKNILFNKNDQGVGIIHALIAIIAVLLLTPVLIFSMNQFLKHSNVSTQRLEQTEAYYDLYLSLFDLSKRIHVPYWDKGNIVSHDDNALTFFYIDGKKNNEVTLAWDDNTVSFDGAIHKQVSLPYEEFSVGITQEDEHSILLIVEITQNKKVHNMLFEVYR